MAAWSLPVGGFSASLVPWLGRLAAVAMLAVIAWLGTHIFWTLSAKESPAPPMALETEPRRAAQAVAARHLFGEVASGPAVVAPIDIRLTGVIAPLRQGETGMAFLALEGKPAVAVREGAEVVPGIILNRVLPRQVELARGPQIQVLMLPESNKTAGRAGNAPPQATRIYEPVPAASSSRRRARRSAAYSTEEE